MNLHPFRIPHDHPALPGHFPGNPVVPGVLLLEKAISFLEATYGPQPALRLPQVKFLRPLLPGQDAVLELELRAPASWRFRVLRDGVVLSTGDITATRAVP